MIKKLLVSLITCTVIYGVDDWDPDFFNEILNVQNHVSATPLTSAPINDDDNDDVFFMLLKKQTDNRAISVTNPAVTTTPPVRAKKLKKNSCSDSEDDEYKPSATDSDITSDEEFLPSDEEDKHPPVKRKRSALKNSIQKKTSVDVDIENPESLDNWYLQFIEQHKKEPSTEMTAFGLGIRNYSCLSKREKNSFASKFRRSKLRLFDKQLWPFALEFAELDEFQQQVWDAAKKLKEEGIQEEDAKSKIKEQLGFVPQKGNKKKNNAKASQFSRAFKKIKRKGLWPWAE